MAMFVRFMLSSFDIFDKEIMIKIHKIYILTKSASCNHGR